MPSYIIPPAGTSAASFFTPVEFVDPSKPPAILARHVDPRTGDWASILRGVHPVDDMVIRAFRVTEGSGPSALGVGNRFIDFKKIDETTERRLDFEIRRILKPMVDRNDLRINRITIEADPNDVAVYAFVEYVNLLDLRTRSIKVTANESGVTVAVIE